MEISDIAKEIKHLIDQNVSKIKHDDQKWKNHYDSVMEELESEIETAEVVIEDFKESKLSINLIEQEGYLRCLRTMVNRFRHYENHL
jgi:hypothetical protein